MERPAPVKKWKYSHLNRRQSGDSMDVSVQSIRSNNSGKYNRFQFRKGDDSNAYSSKEDIRKQPIFVFTGKSKEKNQQVSILSRRSKDKESDTSKISDNDLILKGLAKELQKNNNPLTSKERQQFASVEDILKTVKTITAEFKVLINSFNRKYRDIRYEWDRSFKILLSLKLNQQTQIITDLRDRLERKQEELDQISRISFENNVISLASTLKNQQNLHSTIEKQPSLSKFAPSKVETNRQREYMPRNNTLAQFVGPSGDGGRQVRGLRQIIRRMHQILDE